MLSLGIFSLGDFYSCTGVPPPPTLSVTFGGIEVSLGTTVPYSTAHYSGTPIIKLPSANTSAFYTVAMVWVNRIIVINRQRTNRRAVLHY